MATVMTSPRRPSLPTPNTVTHVRMGYQPKNKSHDAPPPLPSRDQPIRRKTFETNSFIDRNTAKAYSDPSRGVHLERSQSDVHHHSNAQHHSNTQHHSNAQANPARQRQQRAAADEPPPPPLPSSRPPTRPPPQYETAPQPPPVERMPVKKQPSQREIKTTAHHTQATPVVRKQQSTQDIPPALPPARPPKTSVSSSSSIDSGHAPVPSRPPKGQLRSAHSFEDFESRFRFHDPSDFPEPETSDVSAGKAYPSRSIKRKPRKFQDDSIGSL